MPAGFFLATRAPTLHLRSPKRLRNRIRLQQPRCLYERGRTSRPRRAALCRVVRDDQTFMHARCLPWTTLSILGGVVAPRDGSSRGVTTPAVPAAYAAAGMAFHPSTGVVFASVSVTR